jgi:hypothetical protein
MQNVNLTLIDSYCPKEEDENLLKHLITWIEETGALTTVDGKKYIDIPEFDDAILKILDNEREQIQEQYDFYSAAVHVAKVFDIFNTRYEYMDRIRDEYVREINENVEDLKPRFDVAATNFGELAHRLILAYELFFQPEPNEEELARAQKTINVNQYYL